MKPINRGILAILQKENLTSCSHHKCC